MFGAPERLPTFGTDALFLLDNNNILGPGFKGIVSRDFVVLFLIYLDRYEVPNRAGAGLFFF
jgi:hypothetical protein